MIRDTLQDGSLTGATASLAARVRHVNALALDRLEDRGAWGDRDGDSGAFENDVERGLGPRRCDLAWPSYSACRSLTNAMLASSRPP